MHLVATKSFDVLEQANNTDVYTTARICTLFFRNVYNIFFYSATVNFFLIICI